MLFLSQPVVTYIIIHYYRVLLAGTMTYENQRNIDQRNQITYCRRNCNALYFFHNRGTIFQDFCGTWP